GGPLVLATPVQLQMFQVATSQECAVPALSQPRIAATAAAPAAASGKVVVLQPIATIHVTVPEHWHEPPATSIPCPGLVAVEYHIQRTRSNAFARPEWKGARFEP